MKCEVQQSGQESGRSSSVGVHAASRSACGATLFARGVAVLGVFAALQLSPLAADASPRDARVTRTARTATSARTGSVLRRGTAARAARTTTARTARATPAAHAEHAEPSFPELPAGQLYDDNGRAVEITGMFSKETYSPAAGMAAIESRLNGNHAYEPHEGNFHLDFIAAVGEQRTHGEGLHWTAGSGANKTSWGMTSYGSEPGKIVDAIASELAAAPPLARGMLIVQGAQAENGYNTRTRAYVLTHQPGVNGAAGKVRVFATHNGAEVGKEGVMRPFFEGSGGLVWARMH